MGTVNIAAAPGAQNYTLTVPIVNLPGRALPVNLTLTYNSQVWTQVFLQNAEFVFDHQHGWPAVGWSLGFGRLVQMGSEGATVEEPNGMLRPFNGSLSQYSIDFSGSFHTTDGSLIDGTYNLRDDGCLSSGQVLYPDGRAITYGAPDQNCSSGTGVAYPIQITDANGNYISITYVGNHGPAIDRIVDTVGRQISFHYDGNGALVSITGPGLNGDERTLLRFTYKPLNLTTNFYYKVIPLTWPVNRITSLYFPGDSSGFWFNDDNSYSPYGMIRKVSERHSMSLDSNAPANEQREPSAGQMTREREFTYPSDDLGAGNSLAGVPVYTQMFESWAGMTTPRTVTSFSGYWPGEPPAPPLPDSLCSVPGDQTTGPTGKYTVVAEVQLPDGSWQHTLINKEKGDPSFDQPYCESVVAADHKTVLRKTITYREMGDYDSPRVVVREVHDERDRTTKIQYGYDGPGSGATNQLFEVLEKDFDGSTNLRSTTFFPVSDSAYGARHIFNLTKSKVVHGTGVEVERTDYAWDGDVTLTGTPGVIQHELSFDPSATGETIPAHSIQKCVYQTDASGHRIPDCTVTDIPAETIPLYDPATAHRGNVTQVTRFVDTPSDTQTVVENRQYDITGNVRSITGSCCISKTIEYTPATQYSLPEAVTQGNSQSTPPIALVTRAGYDVAAGVPVNQTDANSLTTVSTYDPGSLRVRQILLPTGGKQILEYNDSELSQRITTYAVDGTVLNDEKQIMNGLGLIAQDLRTIGSGQVSEIDYSYDSMHRLAQRSLPHWNGSTSASTTYQYDLLGRIQSVGVPTGGSISTFYDVDDPLYNVTVAGDTRPLQWTSLPSGSRLWRRYDALNRVTTVLEPVPPSDPAGKLAVQTTNYSYDALNRIRQIQQPTFTSPPREWNFSYDGLGRLRAESMPEKRTTLDDNGKYLDNGRWSDVYSYNDHSSLLSHTDARGVTTYFGHFPDPVNPVDDPLDRIYDVVYSNDPAANGASIAGSSTVVFTYMPTGDITRVASQYFVSDGERKLLSFGYDTGGKLATRTLSDYPIVQDTVFRIDYQYDELGRQITLQYPSEPGGPLGFRRHAVTTKYSAGGVPAAMQLDGTDLATQFQYSPWGLTSSVAIGPSGGLQEIESNVYDLQTGQLKSQAVTRAGTPLLNLSYNYTPDNQLYQEIDGPQTTTYSYDSNGRLTTAVGSPEAWSQTYSYDVNGNIPNVTATGTLDGQTMTPDGTVGLMMDPHNHVVGFDYDDAGNLTHGKTADGTWRRYTYDQAGHLARVSDDTGNTLEEYSYAPGNLRLASTASGLTTLYVSDGVHTLSEYQRSGQNSPWSWQHSNLFLGDRRVAELDNGSADGEVLTYLHQGRLGVRLLTNTKDSSYRKQFTLPFGTVIQSTKTTNPVFTGYDRSAVTGEDYAINRDYDAQERRFIQVDPKRSSNLLNPGSLNRYAYAYNSPLSFVDPAGLEGESTENIVSTIGYSVEASAPQAVKLLEAGGYVAEGTSTLMNYESGAAAYTEGVLSVLWKEIVKMNLPFGLGAQPGSQGAAMSGPVSQYYWSSEDGQTEIRGFTNADGTTTSLIQNGTDNTTTLTTNSADGTSSTSYTIQSDGSATFTTYTETKDGTEITTGSAQCMTKSSGDKTTVVCTR